MTMPDVATMYRDGAIQGATPIGLIVLLHERLLCDVRNALAALQSKQIEKRVTYLNHAFLVLQYLQGTLDFDRGNEVAGQLDRFYNHIRKQLLDAQFQESAELMSRQMQAIAEVRDCWIQVDQRTAADVSGRPITPLATSDSVGEPELVNREWHA